MLTCPYCGVRKIALTLHEHDGNYSVCRPCYMRLEQPECDERERRLQQLWLEAWWKLESIHGA